MGAGSAAVAPAGRGWWAGGRGRAFGDVASLRQGAARLGPALAGALLLGLAALLLWRYERGPWPGLDADAKDMLWDFRTTGRGRAAEAAQLAAGAGWRAPAGSPPLPDWFAAPAESLLAGGVRVGGSAALLQGFSRLAGDRRLYGGGNEAFWPYPQRCPGTGHSEFALGGRVALRLPAFAWGAAGPERDQMVAVAFLGDQVAHVPAYRSGFDAGSGAATVSRLSGVTVEVASTGLAPQPWRLVRAAPAYRRVWVGVAADAERAVSSATVNVQVAVESPGRKAAPLKLPPLRTESRMMYCVAYASASGALVLAVLYLFGLVYFRVQENSGLPPPFFKYSAGFRGW